MAEQKRTPAKPLAVGDIIHGYAHGAFGRDHYHCVRIEAVGPDWIVARDPDEPESGPSFAEGDSLRWIAKARDEECTVADQARDRGETDTRCHLSDYVQTGKPAP